MNFIDYEAYLQSEETAKAYFVSYCWPKGDLYCTKCKCQKVYRLAEGRYRCACCGYTFHDFSRRFINNGNLNARDWLRLIKLFELEVPLPQMARQLGKSYNTIAKSIQSVRAALMAQALDADRIFASGLGSSLGTARGKRLQHGPGGGPQRSLVFGVIPYGKLAFVDLLPDLTGETIIHLKTTFHLKTAYLGGIVYTDKYKKYDALLTCDPEIRELAHAPHTDSSLYIDGQKGFWHFAKKRLKSSRRVSCKHLALYLKEIEFRFNYRDEDMFSRIAACLCGLVPRLK